MARTVSGCIPLLPSLCQLSFLPVAAPGAQAAVAWSAMQAGPGHVGMGAQFWPSISTGLITSAGPGEDDQAEGRRKVGQRRQWLGSIVPSADPVQA
jgi:hypothetical protein